MNRYPTTTNCGSTSCWRGSAASIPNTRATPWLTLFAMAHRLELTGRPTPRTIQRTALTAQTDPPHGTRARYGHRTHRCRCTECTIANMMYMRIYRASKAQDGGWTPRTWTELTLPGT